MYCISIVSEEGSRYSHIRPTREKCVSVCIHNEAGIHRQGICNAHIPDNDEIWSDVLICNVFGRVINAHCSSSHVTIHGHITFIR